jgi:hypothetical protein
VEISERVRSLTHVAKLSALSRLAHPFHSADGAAAPMITAAPECRPYGGPPYRHR